MAFILSMSDSESPLDGAVGSTAMDLKLGKLGNIAKKRRRRNTFEILEEKKPGLIKLVKISDSQPLEF